MSLAFLRSMLGAFVAIALLGGCAGYPPTKPFYQRFGFTLPTFKPPIATPTEPQAGDRGDSRIVIRLGEQRAYLYRGENLAGETRVSTGKKGYRTPTGSYRVQQKNRHHISATYGDFVSGGEVVKANVNAHRQQAPEGATFRGARMPWFLRFNGGIGMHAGRVPAYPASHGCVRLPADMARFFYENSSVGTPVRVTQ